MNTKLTLTSLVFILVSLTACQSPSALAKEPAVLPTTIQDPLLTEAWIRLKNHQESIQLPDSSTITGHDLAQFLLDQSIPIVWDNDQKCENASCSQLYCEQDTCLYEDGLPGADPIYISLDIQSMGEVQMNFLVGTLAHEIFHRTAPYGKVQITLYEEFTAFFVGAEIGHAFRLDFVGYDGLKPAALRSWFKDNGLMGAYQQYNLYPQSLDVPVNDSIQDNPCSLPGDFAYGTDQYSQDTCK
jgi:hypothetical protein